MTRDVSGRTSHPTLSTAHAISLSDFPVKRRHDLHIGTTVNKFQDAQTLMLLTGSHTVSAQNTFIRISYDTV